jgi:hypothetical protein
MNSELLIKSFKDFLSPKIIMTSVTSLIITVFIVLFGLYFAFDGFGGLKDEILLVIQSENWLFLEGLKENFIIDFLIKHAIFSFVLNFLFLMGFGLIIYYIFFMIYSFVIGFFSIVIIKDLQSKYYEDIRLDGISIGSSIWFYIKTVLITVVLFILLLPFYFIPILNLVIFLPMYYFFHKTLVFDVSSIINSTQEYQQIKALNWGSLKVKTFVLFLVALVPIVGIILYPFYILFIGHFIFSKTKTIREVGVEKISIV